MILSNKVNRFNESVDEYSLNGSIKHLVRRGKKNDGEYGKIDNLHAYYDGNQLQRVEDNISEDGNGNVNGNNNGMRSMYLFPGGYCNLNDPTVTNTGNPGTDSISYHYYNKDHLGNNREVINESGTIEQIVHYYPFGTPFTDGSSTNIGLQPYLYGNKELEMMHGLNTYDFGARNYNPLLPMWDRVDPKAGDYPWISPYNYCMNNPMRIIDPVGTDTVYYDSKGSELYRYGTNKNVTHIYVMRTSQTAKQIYSESHRDQIGTSNPISKENYDFTVAEIKKGNIKGRHMRNVSYFGKLSQFKAALETIKDDGTHVITPQNNREYSGDFTREGVTNLGVSDTGDPSNGTYLVTYGGKSFHSHPSGRIKNHNDVFGWQQPPSKKDISAVPKNRIHYVFGMDNNILYQYNRFGVISILPINVLK